MPLGLLLPYHSQQRGYALREQSSAPAAYPAGSGIIQLYAANGEPLLMAPGASQPTPLMRTFRNKFRNGAHTIFSIGTAAKNATTTYNKFDSYLTDGWFVLPTGATITQQQGAPISVTGKPSAPGSTQVNGAVGCTGYIYGQRLYNLLTSEMNSSGLYFTASGYIYNNSGSSLTPSLVINTPNTTNDFNATGKTNRLTQALPAIANGASGYWSHSFLPNYTDVTRGMEIAVSIPSGNATSGSIRFGGMMLNEGGHPIPLEIAPMTLEIIRCQAWMNHSYPYGSAPGTNVGLTGLIQAINDGSGANNQIAGVRYPVLMALAPQTADIRIYSGDGSINRVSSTSSGTPAGPASVQAEAGSNSGFRVVQSTSGSFTANTYYTYNYWASCELP